MKDSIISDSSPNVSTMVSTPNDLATPTSDSKAKRSRLKNVLKSASGSSPKKAKPLSKKAVAFSDTAPEVAFQRQSFVGAILLPPQPLEANCVDVLNEESVAKEQRDLWSRIIRFLELLKFWKSQQDAADSSRNSQKGMNLQSPWII